MAVDITAFCENAAEKDTGQSLAVWLVVVFSLYVFVDSSLAAWIIVRKAREADRSSTSSF